MKNISNQKGSIEELTSTYKETNKLLKQIIEKNDVNETLLYDLLDNWAENRKVKIKKR